MIKWIHQNKRSVTVFLVGGVVVLSMSFFGIDMGSSKQQRHAIKIGDETISFEEFGREKRNRIENRIAQLRDRFGSDFSKIPPQLLNIPNQQVVDELVAKKVLLSEAKRLALFTGDESLRSTLRNEVFAGNFNQASYAQYLNSVGMTSRAFEQGLSDDLIIQSYQRILADAVYPSRQEIKSYAEREETKYDVSILEFDPVFFEGHVTLPEDSKLEEFYNSRQTDFENPARITYKYLVLDPDKSLELVEVSDDDIALAYADNESRYMEPETLKARHIQISYPKDADQAKKDELKKRADEALGKAIAGEEFASLVTLYSDDLTTQTNGGDLGWLKRGTKDKRFDDAVFELKNSGIAPLVSTDYGFHIVKVDEYKPAAVKPIESVKNEIIQEIKKREAPAYTAAKAHEIFEDWSKGSNSFEDIATKHKLTIQNVTEPLLSNQDPEPLLRGVTKKIFEDPTNKKQIVELGDKMVIAEITNYEESKVLLFSEAKDRVITTFKREEAKKLARESADKALAGLAEKKYPSLSAAGEQFKVKPSEQKEITQKSPGTGPLTDLDIQSSIFSSAVPLEVPKRVFNIADKYYIPQVTNILRPKKEEIEKKFNDYTQSTLQSNSSNIVLSNLNRLKALAEIDVDSTIFAESKG